MAHLASLSRLASSALTSVRLGTIQTARIPVFTNTSLLNNNEELCKTFRKFNLSPLEARLTANLQSTSNVNALSHLDIKEYRLPSIFKPVNITVPSAYNGAILEKELPPIPTLTELIDPLINIEIREAPSNQVVEKQAARLIVIRRKKMKKHKLKKLRKKMKYVWLKIIQRREYKKEKEFQAEQMAIVREGEAFDAAKYVEDILRRANTKPPRRWFNGKRLPVDIVKELEEKRVEKRRKKEHHKLVIAEMMQELKMKDQNSK